MEAPLKTVPESILKKRKRDEKIAADKAKKLVDLKKARKVTRGEIFKRAENYVREYRRKERDTIRLRRLAKKEGNFYVEAEAKLAFVIRIRGINAVDPKTKKILQLLRLRQINNGVFVKLNSATLTMLRLVEPYIAYGYPTLASVRALVYKRGFLKINKQRVALTENSLIENNLGKHDVICVEDMIHQIFTVGDKFKEVNNFLWPFKLNSPKGGIRAKRIHFLEGGDAGNREHKINELIHKMN